ncbi:zinc ribbon domain-containing protein [Thiofaba sp. EF100]|uniref:zinc ribbon domain-containing protein n=1 Tax=Thiofaba sp. EF100 TaxID=3121274 RepID=UPI0032214DEF
MPSYDYRCPANERVLEVRHGMNESIANWGELCARAGIEPGDTPLDAPVERLISGGALVGSAALKNPSLPPCMSGSGCGGGVCGLS